MCTALALGQPQPAQITCSMCETELRAAWEPWASWVNRMALKEAGQPGHRLGYAWALWALKLISWEPVHFSQSIKGHIEFSPREPRKRNFPLAT